MRLRFGGAGSGLGPVADDRLCDASRRRYRILVLPHPDDRPRLGAQSGVDPPVSFDVGSELGHPVIPVPRGHVLVELATVPEATIHEDGHASTREADVHMTTTWSGSDEAVLPEPQASAVKLRTQCYFCPAVDAPVRLADLRGVWPRRMRVRGVNTPCDPDDTRIHGATDRTATSPGRAKIR